ncbi:MAG: response regulator [Bacteroidota bacterium]
MDIDFRLSISKQLAELMGGTVAPVNIPGCPPLTKPGKEVPVHHAHILLVEDNPTNQFVASKLLEKFGYHVDTATNGLEAIRALGTTAYDLVLMDCQMPELDGLEATRRIRDGSASILNPAVPIIAMTANAMQGDREQCMEAGMSDYITKPVDPALLLKLLKQWLTKNAEQQVPHGEASREPGTAAIWDRAAFLTRVMGDEGLLSAVVREFLKDVPTQLALLAAAVDAGDRDAMQRIAHRLKGASGNVGGILLQEASRRLQDEAQSGTDDRLHELARQTEEEFLRLKNLMQA